ncbi:hypothetical protein A3A95_03110 [Candidatus Nomurabacteria bacterium RIFCSPLOWO2_01_FULL_39_18]|uniref:Major facilitator superfamily (MFS) profile domain-containing protein n=1 Tax=Candidatus Nomurabacteria bacterium RIFCSPHIGHO2_01_FULL_40_24b TaxID=1801739 RepID=A0A1F6V770_9BACT|nr:MAG: hypothetical protein A2647_03455 [Candidatus Nomurabacteria bacterium RIFCSPHIGHO2_01_FULL_40_24b]OGI89646.1 MAG: hypothetical protein A3A95_03110 [Candidatus Nomurabacteria bacterium RIFCSPLOWO2_01_FULL_39_18]
MKNNRKIIYWAVFLSSVPFALTHYINSSFITATVGEKFVGLLYTLGSISSLAVLSFVPIIFRRIGAYKFLIWVAALDVIYFFILAKTRGMLWISTVFVLGFSLNILVSFALDEFLKIFSKNSWLGRVRGIVLIVTHVAFILTQLSVWLYWGSKSFASVYLASSLLTAFFLLVSIFIFRNAPEPEYDKVTHVRFIKEFFKKKNLLRAYGINLLLQIFYSWMIIYTTIYLSIHLGFSWNQIGIMFAIMLIPFLVLPFHLGKYGDTFGERKMLMVGFLVAGFATLAIFFKANGGIIIWTILLLFSRVGASIIEVMSDAYFFKHIKPENEQYIGVYRSTAPLSYILGPLLASFIFLFVPFNFIYLVLCALMLYGVYLSSTIRKGDI